jgi:chaperonin cofactor prefoldin
MKTILTLSILFSAIAMSLCAQAQVSDDTLKTDIAVIQTELKNLKEAIDKGFENVETRFGNVETRFDSIEKNFDRQNNIIIACIGIPWAIIAGSTIWGILTHRRSVRDSTQLKEIENLKEEIETLKQRLLVSR